MSNSKKPAVILYHKDCADGLIAAAIAIANVKAELRKFKAIPCTYNSDLNEVIDVIKSFNEKVELYLLDYSIHPDQLHLLKNLPIDILIWCDHHQTDEYEERYEKFCHENDYYLMTELDKSKCGAELTLEHFCWEGKTTTLSKIDQLNLEQLVLLIADWDLWEKEIPESRYLRYGLINYFGTEEKLILLTTRLFEITDSSIKLNQRFLLQLIDNGKSVTDFLDIQVDALSDRSKWMTFGFYKDVAYARISCPKFMHSEVMHAILNKYDHIGLVINTTYDYQFDNDMVGIVYDFRSRKGEFDCADLAKQYGGGGHPSAAGITFRKGLDEERFITEVLANHALDGL